jgi:uncharacterized repeat protein (TIGR02543 family)
MKKRKVSTQVLLYFFMLMFLMVSAGCSKSDNPPPPPATTYTVTFDSQSATTAANPTSITVTPPATTVVNLPVEPTLTNSTFAGWWTGIGGTGTEFIAGTPVTASITVYAYWTINPVYTVTYNSQGGTAVGVQHVTLPATTVGTLPANPTKTGYNFDSWKTQAEGGGTTFIASTPVTGNITVYAKWDSYEYKVTYDSQGGSAVQFQLVDSPDTTVVTLPTPTKEDSTFAGWNTQADGTGTQFTATTVVIANITVYAIWTTNPVYTVTYDSQGGSLVGAQHVTLPATTVGTLPVNPTRSGYNFGGWFTLTGGGGAQFFASTPVPADITVYAYWTAVTGTGTASGTYSWVSGEHMLIFNWTSSTIPCNGPSLGTDTQTGVTIGTTIMTWAGNDNNMTWTRSTAGAAGDPTGTWTTTSLHDGNTYTAVVTATNSTSGTISVTAPIIACGTGDLNPGVQTSYQPQNSGQKYQVWMWYDENPKTATAVSVTGSGITGKIDFTWVPANGAWNPNSGGNFGDTAPSLPLTYTFTITPPGTTITRTPSCFMTLYPTNLLPTGTGVTLTPTFSWTGISGVSDAVYDVELQDINHNTIWKREVSGTSVAYDGTALTHGTTYNIWLSTSSRSTCLDGLSAIQGSFTTAP